MADDAHTAGEADGDTTRAVDRGPLAGGAPATRRSGTTTANNTVSDNTVGTASDPATEPVAASPGDTESNTVTGTSADSETVDSDAATGTGTEAAAVADAATGSAAGPAGTTSGARSDTVADSDSDSDSDSDEDARPYRELMLQSLGGWRGMVDSALPVVVFVVANVIGGLAVAIWAAVIAGLALMAVRLARRQSVQQAVSGFFGVAIAAFIAHRTGEAKGFFLLGIWGSFVYAGVFLVSILVRWPAVGVIWEYLDNGTTTWRSQRRLMRVYSWTTLVWVAMFLSRGLVQRFLYDEDRTGWLAFARLAMGYPLTLIALGVTLLAVRRARALHAAAQPADPQPAGATTTPGPSGPTGTTGEPD